MSASKKPSSSKKAPAKKKAAPKKAPAKKKAAPKKTVSTETVKSALLDTQPVAKIIYANDIQKPVLRKRVLSWLFGGR